MKDSPTDLFLFLHTSEAPSKELFEQSIRDFGGDRSCERRRQVALVFSCRHRRWLAEFVAACEFQPSSSTDGRSDRREITDQAMVRGVVTESAGSILHQGLLAQQPGPSAGHVGLVSEDVPAVLAELKQLQQRWRRVRSLVS